MNADRESTRSMVRAALFAALTAVGGLLAVPLPWSAVPMTLQTMFTLMAGLLLGGRNGPFSQLVYVAMGVVGVPVFARGSAGLGVLLGPTGGYLLGFVAGAGLTGMLAERVRRWTGMGAWRLGGYVLSALLGLVTIDLLGVWRLVAVMEITWQKAVAVGVVPFLLSDLVKAVGAAVLVAALEKRGIVEE